MNLRTEAIRHAKKGISWLMFYDKFKLHNVSYEERIELHDIYYVNFPSDI